MAVRDRLRNLFYYPHALSSRYRTDGVGGVLSEIRTHLWWRWYRLRMHPRYRVGYTALLRLGRLLRPTRFTDADPFKIIRVDPTEIEHRATGLPSVWGRVIGGNWKLESLTADPTYQGLIQRFRDGSTWSELEYEISEHGLWERLYESMSQHGYISQSEIVESDEDRRWDCEIGVAIDADGNVAWVKRGSHRLRMAKVLELESVAVHVRIRHPRWQAIRDEIRDANTVDELSEQAQLHLDHPDLADVRKDLAQRQHDR